MGVRDLSDVLWSATKVGIFSGVAIVTLFVGWAGFPTEISKIGELIVSLIAVIFVTAMVGGPIVLIATALFGTPAAILVNRLRMGRITSLALVCAFAAMPIMALLWSDGRWSNGQDGKTYNDLIVFYTLVALPAALTLWRGLMRKRQTF